MDGTHTLKCSHCHTERTYPLRDGQTIRVTHQCPDYWARVA